MKKFTLFLALTISCLFYGCAKKEVPPVVIEKPTAPAEKEKVGPEIPKKEQPVEKMGLEEHLKETEKKAEKSDLERIKLYGRGTAPFMAIFFDYDDFSIRSDMWDRIRNNAKLLLEKKNLQVILQGNCDERGTNEYNLALGMKRALEVKRALVRLGVEESRVEVVSFGEEKPICTQADESCYALNRRVDFVVKQ